MVDTRRRNRNPSDDDNGYGDPPTGGAVGFRGARGREYRGGYGSDTDDFLGGVVDDGHGRLPRGDEGFAPPFSEHSSGYGAFGHIDRSGDQRGSERNEEERPIAGQHRGRGPKGYQRSDERIREDVCERLTSDPFIDATNMEVEVKGREVTLSGTVVTRNLRRRAEDIVEMVSGVTHVQNNLRVDNGSR